MNPHFWRTHDGGKTWTEINTGIARAPSRTRFARIRDKRGLLYAATDLQVWVSFDDGDHWQSLKFDMPAISVRDLQVKDDSTCLCSDLIAGTHGRGFWILDNLTPLRQAAEARAAQAAGSAYLFKPATAVRVRFGTNDPTPWPPELPAGENPLPGGIIDYNLAKDASAPITLDIVDVAGKVVRHYSSDDHVRESESRARSCRVRQGLSAERRARPIVRCRCIGRRRRSGSRHGPASTASRGTCTSTRSARIPTPAMKARTARCRITRTTSRTRHGRRRVPTSVRLTVDGKQYTQPITLRLDPRVKTSAAGLAQLNAVTRETYDAAVAAHAAYEQARALVAELDKLSGGDVAAFKAQVEAVAPAGATGRRGRGFGGPGGGGPAPPPKLESGSAAMMAAAMAMQGADVAPTAGQVAGAAKARADGEAALRAWAALRTTGLASLNAKRRAAGQPAVSLPVPR